MTIWPAKLCALSRGTHSVALGDEERIFDEVRLSWVCDALGAVSHCFGGTGLRPPRSIIGQTPLIGLTSIQEGILYSDGLSKPPRNCRAEHPRRSPLPGQLGAAGCDFTEVQEFWAKTFDADAKAKRNPFGAYGFDANAIDLGSFYEAVSIWSARTLCLGGGLPSSHPPPGEAHHRDPRTWELYNSSVGYEPPGVVPVFAKPYSTFPRAVLDDFRRLHPSELDEWSGVWLSAALGEVPLQVIYEWLDLRGIHRCCAHHVQWRA